MIWTKNKLSLLWNGLEASDDTLHLTGQLSKLLEKTYDIKPDALGWPNQIQKFGDKEATDWWNAFKNLTEYLLHDRI